MSANGKEAADGDAAAPPPRPGRDRIDRFFSWVENLPRGMKILAMIYIVAPIYLTGFASLLLTFGFCAYVSWPYGLETPLLLSIPLFLCGPVAFGAFLVLANRLGIWRKREHRPWRKAALWRACYMRVAWLLAAGQAAMLAIFFDGRHEFFYTAVSISAALLLSLKAGVDTRSNNFAAIYEELFEDEASRVPLLWIVAAFVPIEAAFVTIMYAMLKHYNGGP